jgi:hypothetical protein
MKYVKLVEQVLSERHIGFNSIICQKLHKIINVLFLDELKNGKNILVQRNKNIEVNEIRDDIVEVSKYLLIGKDDKNEIGLTKKGFKLATGGEVLADNYDISIEEFKKHREELKNKIKDKSHPLAKKKGWIEMVYRMANGDLATRALTTKERKELMKKQANN